MTQWTQHAWDCKDKDTDRQIRQIDRQTVIELTKKLQLAKKGHANSLLRSYMDGCTHDCG